MLSRDHAALQDGMATRLPCTVPEQVTSENRYRFDQACRVNAITLAVRINIKDLLSINFLLKAVYELKTCLKATLAARMEKYFLTSQIIFEVTDSENVSDRKHLVSLLEGTSCLRVSYGNR